ncbi:MAG TPA: ROK family protein [Catenuloplanes sp.]|jgi:glucokinase
MTTRPVLAVDIGGTKFAASIVEPDGTLRARTVVPTPSSIDTATVAAALTTLVSQVVAQGPPGQLGALGVGSAGPVNPAAGTVSPVNIPAWRDFDVLAALRPLLPGRPAVLAGDAHCMAFGEYHHGRSRPAAMLGIVVSTGVGGGLVLNGDVLSGATGNAGHIGHVVVDIDGPPCPCGGRGCVETFASGPAIVRQARGYGWTAGDGPADARAVAAAARDGHPAARAAYRRAGRAVAAGIVSAAALIELDEVVIGGGVAGAGDLLFTPIRRSIAELAGLPFVRQVRVSQSQLGGDAGLLGAAALAFAAAGRSDRRDAALAHGRRRAWRHPGGS